MRLALSTLGCPEWDLERITETTVACGYDGVDVRGYLDEVDVTRHPLFTDSPEAVAAHLDEAGVSVSALGSSVRLCEADDRDEHVEEAQRFLTLAREVGVDRVRVFGGGDPEVDAAELAATAAETMREIRALDGAEDVRWLVETHDTWTASPDCLTLLDALPGYTGVIWDVAHTTRVAGESPAETLDALGERVEYVHLKDAVRTPDATEDGWTYVVPGTGDLPIAEAVCELWDKGYDGWAAFEHEKRWHPSIADPADAFPAFVEWFRSLDNE